MFDIYVNFVYKNLFLVFDYFLGLLLFFEILNLYR